MRASRAPGGSGFRGFLVEGYPPPPSLRPKHCASPEHANPFLDRHFCGAEREVTRMTAHCVWGGETRKEGLERASEACCRLPQRCAPPPPPRPKSMKSRPQTRSRRLVGNCGPLVVTHWRFAVNRH